MSSHHPRSGSAAATPTPTPTPPLPPSSSTSQGSLSQSQQRQQKKPRPGGDAGAPAADEQPGLEVVPTGSLVGAPRASGTGRRRADDREPAPEVYWSDDNNANPSQYTFYRDPTPTPPEYSEREKDGEARGTSPLPRRPGRSSTVAMETALAIEPREPRSSSKQETICGLRRWVFYCALAAVLFLVIGIALGVGVGVGVSKKLNQQGQPSGANSGSSLPPTTVGPTTTAPPSSFSSSSPSTSLSVAPNPAPTASTDCPFINNTIYLVPGSKVQFLRLCGVDYSGPSEAVDIIHKPTWSFADCLDNCAGTYGCTACSWGVAEGETAGGAHQCWMKSNLRKGHTAASDWCFGILQ